MEREEGCNHSNFPHTEGSGQCERKRKMEGEYRGT